MSYFDEITRAMGLLAEHPKTIFLGQSVKYPGQRAHKTFEKVPVWKKIELPICEEFSVGVCHGLALEGYIPVLFIPRWDFLLLAANQLVNHLDKHPCPVIIRTAVGATKPLNPGPQHTQNHTEAFSLMMHKTPIYELTEAEDIVPRYESALKGELGFPIIMVEQMEKY